MSEEEEKIWDSPFKPESEALIVEYVSMLKVALRSKEGALCKPCNVDPDPLYLSANFQCQKT